MFPLVNYAKEMCGLLFYCFIQRFKGNIYTLIIVKVELQGAWFLEVA